MVVNVALFGLQAGIMYVGKLEKKIFAIEK